MNRRRVPSTSDQAGRGRRVEHGGSLTSGRLRHDLDGGATERGHEEHDLTRLGPERREAREGELAQGRRNRQRLPREQLAAVERANELEREERIPAGGLVDADQRRAAGNRGTGADHLVQRAERQRPHVDPIRLAERERLCAGTRRGEERHRLTVETPEHVVERRAGGRIEPLRVVDGDGHAGLVGEQAQQVEGSEPDRTLVGESSVVRREQERELERPASRKRQLGEPSARRLEKVTEGRERQLSFGLRRSRAEHQEPAIACRVDAGAPQRRLADPGLPLEPERGRAGVAVQERFDPGELELAPEQRPRAGGGLHVHSRSHRRAALSMTFVPVRRLSR